MQLVTSIKQRLPWAGPQEVPFRRRLRAWWDGCEPSLEATGKVADDEVQAARSDEKNAKPEAPIIVEKGWTDTRIKIAERLWGEGFLTPGGADYAINLVKPLALDPKKSLLVLGARLGGAARAIAEESGVWITGQEKDAQLAERGMDISTRAGLEKRVPIAHYDPENYELKAHFYDCAFAKEEFFVVADKEHLFDALYRGLKRDGHLMFTDFVLQKPGISSPAIEKWAAREAYPLHLWSVEQVTACLKNRGFDIRIIEDISEEYRRIVMAGWGEFTRQLRHEAVDPGIGPVLTDEAELWQCRMEALRNGDIQLYRFHAIKNEESELR
jgi:cyclopropane fatty-acyl-phospholipid synthase-like methyltransferase